MRAFFFDGRNDRGKRRSNSSGLNSKPVAKALQ